MSFFTELKRRNVIRVGLAYVVVGWLTSQVAEFATENFGAPDWVLKIFVVFLLLGLPFVLIFAWAFEMTPEGLKKEKDVDRTQTITKQTGRKLDLAIIGVLVLVAGYFIWESRFQNGGPAEVGPASIPLSGTSKTVSPVNGELTLTPVIATGNSIAVLPFANRSNQEEDLFFTDGIHDDLLTQLAKIADLKVISRTSVMKYKNTEKTIPEIAVELGVSTILEGGIQRAGNRIRINAQLIDVNTDEHLWAETFDREMTVENIFDIQSEITRQIVNAVRGELTNEETDALAQLPTRSLEAYEAYLHAKNIFLQPDYTRQKFEEAEPWLEKAVELDPGFALAWAMLVRTYAQGIWQGYDDSVERLQQVRQALSKATEFGPFLPETLAARGEYLYRIENNYHEAEVAFRAATKASPRDANLLKLLAYTLRRTGKAEQAVSSFQLAFELEPGDGEARSAMIETLIYMREYDRAEPLITSWMETYPEAMDIKGNYLWLMVYRDGDLAHARNLFAQIEPNAGAPYRDAAFYLPLLERDYQKAIDIYDSPKLSGFFDDPVSRGYELIGKSQVYGYMGNQELALEFAQRAIKAFLELQSASSGSNKSDAQNLAALAIAYAQTGDLAKALEAANQACTLIPESRDSYAGVGLSQTRAWILAMSGNRDEALLEIQRLLSVPGGFDRWLLYLDPQWDFFRDDERFNEMIRPLNLEEQAQ
ncbi:MAG: hypothetical protein WBS20_06860 [Lysobacterales bacterium]